jgi:hypothetical protein
MAKQYTDTLENVCSFSFPSNHLVVFALVRATPQQNIQQQNNAKPEYFSFLTLAPGEGGADSRTYNFQNKLVVKFSLQEIAGLSFVLKSWANGLGKAVFPYVKFARSANGQKMVSVWEGQQQQGNQPKARTVQLSIKENNNNPVSISLTPDQAFAMAETLQAMFNKGIELEIHRQINSPKINNNNKPLSNGSSYTQKNAETDTPTMGDGNPFDITPDFSGIGNEFENMMMGVK